MQRDENELEMLLDLIDEEPAKRHVETFAGALESGLRLNEWLAGRLQDVLSRAGAELRPGLWRAVALHAIAAGEWSLVPGPGELTEDEVRGVLRAIESLRRECDPEPDVWEWLEDARAAHPAVEFRVDSVIEAGVKCGWHLGGRHGRFLEALSRPPEGKGRQKKDVGRYAAEVLLHALQVEPDRATILPELEELARDGEPPARLQAVWCLAADAGFRDEWERVEPLTGKSKELAAAVEGIGVAIGHHARGDGTPARAAGAIPLLCRALEQGSLATRKEALDAVWTMSYWGKLDVNAALPEVERALSHDKLRAQAVKVIGAVGLQDAAAVAGFRETLESLADDGSKIVRTAVRGALQQMQIGRS